MRRAFRRLYIAGGLFFLAALCTALLGAEYLRVRGSTISVTNTNDSGPGSLRQALADVDNFGTIQFDPALSGQTITLTSGELVVGKIVTINGAGPGLLTIARDQQAPNFRILHIMTGYTVTITGLTISNGQLQSENGAGIFNESGFLTLNNCAVSGNIVNSNSISEGGGGGVYNTGNLNLVHTIVSNNSATGLSAIVGGGLYNAGNALITQSSINNNSADFGGGGIYSNYRLTVRNSTVSNNHSGSNMAHPSGAGGGILNIGLLIIRNCTITANTASGDASDGWGGGIYTGAPLQIFHSTVSGNTASRDGGGIVSNDYIALINCTVSNNQAENGAGIWVASDPASTITNSSIVDNISSGSGGGLNGNIVVTNSVINGNTAQFDGGGLYGGGSFTNSSVTNNRADRNGGGIFASQTLTVTNSTLASNVATQDGGGVYGNLTITNSTISANRVEQRNGGGLYGGGAITHSTITANHGGKGGDAITVFGPLMLSHTILTSDTALGTISNDGGTVTSLGYNLSSDKAGGFLNAIGDRTNTDPILGPLQNNSGPTLTHLLLKGSPAIDTGDSKFTPPPSTDQRGLERVYTARIDIGSVEIQPIPTPTPTPTPGPATHFALAVPDAVFPGQQFDFLVTAQDQFNNTVTDYAGTVHFTSTSTGQLPFDDTLPHGIDVFAAALGNDGFQTITATDTKNPSVTGTSDPIYVIPESGGSPTPVPSPPLPTPTPSPAQSLNLSTRMLVQTGDNVGIGGFIITGSAPKQVVLRGIGPSLSDFGIPNPLPDPVLELHGSPGFVTIINDDWRDGTCDCTGPICVPPGPGPPNDLESCILVTLGPGPYSAVVRGKNNDLGVGLVEVYDVDQAATSKLANISTRAFVSTGSDIVIAGFILGGNAAPTNMILRGIGPSLTNFGVPNALANPTLELRDSSGTLIRANNDWHDDPTQAAIITAAGLAPTDNLESGIAATLAPGQYTALLAGQDNGTGIGLVEVYDRESP